VEARRKLTCPRDCDRACQACLLAYDTQHDRERLDRKAALRFLSDELLQALKLPPEQRRFGEATRVEWQHPVDGLLRMARRHGVKRTRIVFHGAPESWDLGGWSGLRPLQQLVDQGAEIELVMRAGAVRSLDWSHASQLANLMEFAHFHVVESADPALWSGPQRVFAEMVHKEGLSGFATNVEDALVPGPEWLETPPGSISVFGRLTHSLLPADLRSLSMAEVRRDPPTHIKEIKLTPRSGVEGSIHGLGDRFWRALDAQDPGLLEYLTRAPAVELSYDDRYLKSPAYARCLFEALDTLARRGAVNAQTLIRIRSIEARSELGKEPRYIDHDWREASDQRGVLHGLLSQLSSRVVVELIASKEALPHARLMNIRWSDGRSFELRLDQGFGFLRGRGGPFAFYAGVANQVTQLLGRSWALTLSSTYPAFFYARRG
jgi:hypothetical protein